MWVREHEDVGSLFLFRTQLGQDVSRFYMPHFQNPGAVGREAMVCT